MSITPEHAFPVERLRTKFPALQRAGNGVFFDNAAGAQVPQSVFDAINEHLLERMVQRGGRYSQSIAVDESLVRARASVAALVNARDPNEIAFGMNATSFIRLVSLAIGQTLGERNEIIVTDLDHEANVATWLALEPLGARFRWWRMRDDGNLYLEDLAQLMSPKTRLLACTVASNALGTIVDIRGAADLVHGAGGEIFLDSVHFAPHGCVDVQAFDCDYLVCSGYKIFGPHMGFLWGRYQLLERLPTFREDFIPDVPPGKIEAGTVSYENIAGMDAAVRYLARLGRSLASGRADSGADVEGVGRTDIARAMQAILAYERTLSLEMLKLLRECNARVHGIADPARIASRVPTLAFNIQGVTPSAVTETMARAGIGIRDGHLYCPRLMRRLALPEASGTVRVSLVHYNTVAEIHRFGNVLFDLARQRSSTRHMNSDEPPEPLIAGTKPAYRELVAGRRYLWCRCGRSKNQPFCDGSHEDTGFQPLAYVAKYDKEEALFCMCKRTGTPPFCDGAHSNVPGGYEVESAESVAASTVPWAPETDGGVRRLDEFCYTIRAAATRPANPGPFWMRTLVDAARGAAHQTQVYVEVRDRASPILSAGKSAQTIIFIAAGTGSVDIGTQRFDVSPLDGVMVLPAEGFRLTADEGACLRVFISVYPVVAGLQTLDAMPPFDASQPERTASVDVQQRHAMGPRFFQHLVDRRLGALNAVQFIGHIPQSKAQMHRHLYEEALLIVSGEGVIWNENVRAPVVPGDVIFFPRKHVHSLQCTSAEGMDVVGVIHPGENPGINY